MKKSALFLFLFTSFGLSRMQLSAAAVPASITLSKISATGSKRLPEADILRAIGLKAGVPISPNDIKQAADRVGQSGVFMQVTYRYFGQDLDYTVVDAEKFVPATFENFVWFEDAELMHRVHDSVPLFTGDIPLSGNLADQVAGALDGILKEKGIQGHVSAIPQANLGQQPQAMQFSIEGMKAKIAEVRFSGADPQRLSLLQEATKFMLGGDYSQVTAALQIKMNAPQVYGKMGYLKAQFGRPKPLVLKDDPKEPLVAVEVPVQEGEQFTFAAANWSGNSAISAAELNKTIDLKAGAPADTSRLGKDIALAKDLYGARGYMDAQVKTTAALDAGKHTAIFNLALNEGTLYHMGKLEIQNLDAPRAEGVRRVWGMHEGDLYDSHYVRGFLKAHPRELEALNGWAANWTQTIHDDQHVVDLLLKFVKLQHEGK